MGGGPGAFSPGAALAQGIRGRFRAKREHLERLEGLGPESQGFDRLECAMFRTLSIFVTAYGDIRLLQVCFPAKRKQLKAC